MSGRWDSDEKRVGDKAKRIEERGEYDTVDFMGSKYSYKKNSWKDYGIVGKRTERIWSRIPDNTGRKPTEYQQAIKILSKMIDAHPNIKNKTGVQRTAIRKMVKEEFYKMELQSITMENVKALIDRCMNSFDTR